MNSNRVCAFCGKEENPTNPNCEGCGIKFPDRESVQSHTIGLVNQNVDNNEISISPIISQEENKNTIIEEPILNENNDNKLEINFLKENETINDDALINAYIGKNADKLKKGGFSWCTLFFGILYTLYRKMWKFSLINIIVVVIVSKIFDKVVSLLFASGTINLYTLLSFSYLFGFVKFILIDIGFAFLFKKQYLKYVKTKVNEIRAQHRNKSQIELEQICASKGGTFILPIIIGLLLMLPFIVTSLAKIYKNKVEEDVLNQAKKYVEIAKDWYEERPTEYSYYENMTCIKISTLNSYEKIYNSDYSGYIEFEDGDYRISLDYKHTFNIYKVKASELDINDVRSASIINIPSECE